MCLYSVVAASSVCQTSRLKLGKQGFSQSLVIMSPLLTWAYACKTYVPELTWLLYVRHDAAHARLHAYTWKGSIIHVLGLALDSCRTLKDLLLAVTETPGELATEQDATLPTPMAESGWGKVRQLRLAAKRGIHTIISARVKEAMVSMMEEVSQLLDGLVVRSELTFFGGLLHRLQNLAETTWQLAYAQPLVDLEEMALHLHQCIHLLEW